MSVMFKVVMKQKLLILWSVPLINILIMNILTYIEELWMEKDYCNWGVQFFFVIANLILLILHYILSFVLPFFYIKIKNIFTYKSCVFTTTAVLTANIIMLALELSLIKFEYLPQYTLRTICISMFTVSIVSILFMIKYKRGMPRLQR